MEPRNRSCLLLHGFTGGPFEIMPLADHLKKKLGVHCCVPILPGHDAELSSLATVTYHDWLDAAAVETHRLTRQYESVDLIGFSMGGLIAAFLANRFPVRRLVLLSAAAIYVSPVRFLRELAGRLRTRDFAQLHRAKRTPPHATVEFMKLARYTKQWELPRIQVPTLVIQGGRDQIVHPRSGHYIYEQLKGERQLRLFPHSRHRICLDQEAPELFAEVERFLYHPQ